MGNHEVWALEMNGKNCLFGTIFESGYLPENHFEIQEYDFLIILVHIMTDFLAEASSEVFIEAWDKLSAQFGEILALPFSDRLGEINHV